jgi:hypothetical protein
LRMDVRYALACRCLSSGALENQRQAKAYRTLL